MGNQSQKYHQVLAEYFHSKDYFLESIEEQRKMAKLLPSTSRSVNIRKVVELPWQYFREGIWEKLEKIFFDISFLEAKAESGKAFELASDFKQFIQLLQINNKEHKILCLLEEAITRDTHFISRHPTALFQCLWNSCWWFDCPQAKYHYIIEEKELAKGYPTWSKTEPRLYYLLEAWRKEKEVSIPGFCWFEALTPASSIPLGHDAEIIFGGHQGWVMFAKLNQSEDKVASGEAFSPIIHVWDIKSRQSLLKIIGDAMRYTCIAWSPSGELLASNSSNGIRIWNSKNGTIVKEILFSEPVTALLFGSTDEVLFAGTRSNLIKKLNVELGLIIDQGQGHGTAVMSLALSADGRFLFSSGINSIIKRWKITPFQLDMALNLGENVASARFSLSTNSKRLALCERLHSGEYRVVIRDAQTGELTSKPLFTTSDDVQINAIDWGHNDNRIAFNEGSQIHIVDLESNYHQILSGHGKVVGSVQFAKRSNILLSGGWDTIKIWNLKNNKTNYQNLEPRYLTKKTIICPTGDIIATVPNFSKPKNSTDSFLVRLWDLSDVKPFKDLEAHYGSVNTMQWTRDGNRLASSGCDSLVVIWDIRTNERVDVNIPEESEEICFAPDQRFLACACQNGTLQIIDTWNGDILISLDMPHPLKSERQIIIQMPLAFHPMTNSISCGYDFSQAILIPGENSTSSRIYIWHLPDGVLLHVLKGHVLPVTSLCYHPSGKWLASGSRDKTIRIWDVSDGKCLYVLEGHTGSIDKLTFSLDGTILFSLQGILSLPYTYLWDWKKASNIDKLDGQFDIDNLALVWGIDDFNFPSYIANNCANECQLVSALSLQILGAVPSAYGTKFQWNKNNTLVGCDWKHLYIYRLNGNLRKISHINRESFV